MNNVALYRNIMLKLNESIKNTINEMNYNINKDSFTGNDYSLFISADEAYEKYNMSVDELESILNSNSELSDLWVSGVDDGIQIWTADKTLYDTLCAYLNELCDTYGRPRIGRLHEDLNLNRGDVYQFGNICLRPLVKETIKACKPKWESIPSKDDKTIAVIYKAGNKKLHISLLNNFGNKDFIRFSMYNFTSKVINAYGFIDNDKLYIIDSSKVLAVWNNPRICKVETNRMYRDANGSDSMFTQVNKQWLIDNSDYIMDVDTTSNAYLRYMTNYKNF